MAYEESKKIRREIGLKWGWTEEQINEQEERIEQRLRQKTIFEAKRDKIISALLQQCADEDLTYGEARDIAREASDRIICLINDKLAEISQSWVELKASHNLGSIIMKEKGVNEEIDDTLSLQNKVSKLETQVGTLTGQLNMISMTISNVVQKQNLLHKTLYKEISESIIAVVHDVLGRQNNT